MASVDIQSLHKSYGGTPVLRDIDLTIPDREFVVFVGPSGCGKSTLLRLIAGLEGVSGGQIRIDGTVVNQIQAKERDIAMVFQNYALYPHMTVFDNMAFSLKMRHLPREDIRRRVEEAAEILNLQPFLKRRPGQLSGGQRQRVAMGRAIVRSPKVFLFDEPLSNLDAKLRVQMRSEIKALHQRLQTTIVYVTHDQVEAMTMADRIVVINQGRIEQVGRPLDLYDQPQNLFVAGFIGSPAMNAFDARVRRQGDRVAVAAGDLVLPLSHEIERADGAEVVCGVRPEYLSPSDADGIEGRIVAIEPTGPQTFVNVDLCGQAMVASISERRAMREGDVVTWRIAEDKLMLFDKATGVRL